MIHTRKLSRLSLKDYTYLTQCLQYYILKNSIAIHRSKYPTNMGTLLWQLNDCWPVASWSITDYSRKPKAAWYAVKEAYRNEMLTKKETVYPKRPEAREAWLCIIGSRQQDIYQCYYSSKICVPGDRRWYPWILRQLFWPGAGKDKDHHLQQTHCFTSWH